MTITLDFNVKDYSASKKGYLKKVLISLDQLANTLFGPLLNKALPKNNVHGLLIGCSYFGFPDETLSSVLGKNAPHVSWCYVMCRILSVFDQDHCKKSIEEDEGDYRGG